MMGKVTPRQHLRCRAPRHSLFSTGWVAERLKAAVLKTAVRASVPWVRIPPHPPIIADFGALEGKNSNCPLIYPLLMFRIVAKGASEEVHGRRSTVSVSISSISRVPLVPGVPQVADWRNPSFSGHVRWNPLQRG